MNVAIRVRDISVFIVAAMAVVGESIAPEQVTPDMLASFLTMVTRWPPAEKGAWVQMLAAEASDEQWSVCVRVLRSIAVAPQFAIFVSLTARADELRRQPEWVARARAQTDRARAQAEQEIRLAKGGKLS